MHIRVSGKVSQFTVTTFGQLSVVDTSFYFSLILHCPGDGCQARYSISTVDISLSLKNSRTVSVTRWPHYFFNIWPLKAKNFAHSYQKFNKLGTKQCQVINRPFNFAKVFQIYFAKSVHTTLTLSLCLLYALTLEHAFSLILDPFFKVFVLISGRLFCESFFFSLSLSDFSFCSNHFTCLSLALSFLSLLSNLPHSFCHNF